MINPKVIYIPTIIVTTNPKFKSMCEEIFGSVDIYIYVYDEKNWEETLKLVDTTSEYCPYKALFSLLIGMSSIMQ